MKKFDTRFVLFLCGLTIVFCGLAIFCGHGTVTAWRSYRATGSIDSFIFLSEFGGGLISSLILTGASISYLLHEIYEHFFKRGK